VVTFVVGANLFFTQEGTLMVSCIVRTTTTALALMMLVFLLGAIIALKFIDRDRR